MEIADINLENSLGSCIGKTIKFTKVNRKDDIHGSHPEVTIEFTDGTKIVFGSIDDYDKVSWIMVYD